MSSFIPDTTNTAIWAMITACALPFIFMWIAKISGGFKAENNINPREFLANLTGLPARAHAVQQNSFETLPMFLAGVILAMLFFVPQLAVNSFAWMYVLIRVIYGIAYLSNLSLFRSVLWFLSMACIFMLFYITMRMG